MIRNFRFKTGELPRKCVSRIVRHLDRVSRNRDQVRCRNSKGFLYCFAIKKINSKSFEAWVAGPDNNQERWTRTIFVHVRVTENEFEQPQIDVISRDGATSYECAMKVAKHAINKIEKSLEKKPLKFDDGLDKSDWDGFFLSHSGKHDLWDDFDEVFDKAISENYFPKEFKEVCREIGFNIERCHRKTSSTSTQFPQM